MSLENNNEEIGSLVSGNMPTSSESMDAKREASIIRDFLLKLDQARAWVCTITGDRFDITGFTEELPKGTILAKVAQSFDPDTVQRIFKGSVKEYRHVDNIVAFLEWCKRIKLRKHFLFETIDLYESKNIPNVIYCLHGLAMFLNKRGVSKGIVVNKNVKFTEEEALLFSSDLASASLPSYENIDLKLDSEDESEESAVIIRHSVSPISHPDESRSLQKAFSRTLLWRRAFQTLISGSGTDVSTIRRFFDAHVLDDTHHKILIDQQNEIIEKFKTNNKKEAEIDSLVHTIRLLHENVRTLRGVSFDSYPLANDFRAVKMILFRLIHDYDLCFSLFFAGFELPMRTMFPDTTMGDFLFSKFIKKNIEKDQKLPISIARTHFMSSKIFRNISEVFATTHNFDLSPTNIKYHLCQMGYATHEIDYSADPSKQILLDDALNDDLVKNEILKRAQMIVDFVDAKFKYLININLPYYVKIFSGHPQFYENFIEPAILASGNHAIAEVFGYIFARDAYIPNVLDIERVIKDKDGITRSSSIDFSDYSPLKNFLNECRSSKKNFKEILSRHHSVNLDPNDYFIECATSDDILQVEISIEEINNIIVVLKHNIDLMTPEFAAQVKSMKFVRANAGNGVRIELCSDVSDSRESSPIRIDGVVNFTDQSSNLQKYREIEINSEKPLFIREATEKFVLRLDNQFSNELDKFDSDLRRILSYDFKRNVLLLILASKHSSLEAILNDKTAVNSPLINDPDLLALKSLIIEEINLLVKSKLITENHQRIIDIIAKDFVSRKCGSLSREISLNSETLDALFQKSLKLDQSLKSLYKYTSDLTESMFTNKSGVFFNRQSEPHSKYGTYLIPLDDFKAQVYEALDTSQMAIQISSEEPMIFQISVFFRKELLSQPIFLRYDSLLKMQEEEILCVDISQVCCLSVSATIAVINESYVNY